MSWSDSPEVVSCSQLWRILFLDMSGWFFVCCGGPHWHQDLHPGKKFREEALSRSQAVSTRPDFRYLSCTTLILLSRDQRSRNRRIAEAMRTNRQQSQTQEAGLRASCPRLLLPPPSRHRGRDKDEAVACSSASFSAFPSVSSIQAARLG